MESNNSVTLSGLSDSPTFEELMNYLTGRIDVATTEGIDKEIGPILEDVTMLDMYSYNSWSEKLFDWLINPSRTVDEFGYAVGPLAQRILKCYFVNSSYNRDRHQHFCKCLAEALAARNPVLEGSWEHVAWLLVCYNHVNLSENIADHLSVRFENWLIKVTGDNNFCPNPYLRIELLGLFGHLLYVKKRPSGPNKEKYVQSIMFAWSSLKNEQLNNYIKLCYKDELFIMDPLKIHIMLDLFRFDENNILLFYDKKLSEELRVKMSRRLSAINQDVSYKYAIKTCVKTEPMELRALSALLQSLSMFAVCAENNGDTNLFENTAWALETLIENFNSSCMMPQLIGDVTKSISQVMYYVFLTEYDPDDPDDDGNQGSTSFMFARAMEHFEFILCSLTLQFGITDPCESAIGRELIHCNERLSYYLGIECCDQENYPTMFSLLSSGQNKYHS